MNVLPLEGGGKNSRWIRNSRMSHIPASACLSLGGPGRWLGVGPTGGALCPTLPTGTKPPVEPS